MCMRGSWVRPRKIQSFFSFSSSGRRAARRSSCRCSSCRRHRRRTAAQLGLGLGHEEDEEATCGMDGALGCCDDGPLSRSGRHAPERLF